MSIDTAGMQSVLDGMHYRTDMGDSEKVGIQIWCRYKAIVPLRHLYKMIVTS